MKNQNYFFCYNKQLFKFLHDVKGIDYITTAKDIRTGKIFSLFEKGEDLQQALDEYKELQEQEEGR